MLDLVGERGIEALAVGAVCERASVSKKHFYEECDGIDALAGEVLTDALADVHSMIVRTHPGNTANGDVDLFRGAVEAILAVFDDSRMARLYLEASGNRGLREARDAAVGRFVDEFLVVLSPTDPADPRARVLARLLVAGTTDVVASWLRGDVTLEREELVAGLVALGSDAAQRIRRRDYGVTPTSAEMG